MSARLTYLAGGEFIRHRFRAPDGWQLCAQCGQVENSDEHHHLPKGWEPIETAPQNATWIEVIMTTGAKIEAHWAQDLSGENQPPFRGWFNRKLCGIEKPDGWRPLRMQE